MDCKEPEEIENNVYVAGAKTSDSKIVTAGGRVLGATAVADDLASAVKASYGLVSKIKFDNAYFRKDIGKRALAALEVK